MNNSVKEVISSFSRAVEARNKEQLELLLHPDFVVMANRFKGAAGMTLMPKSIYLGAMATGSIGGTHYDVEFISVSVFEHNAAVEVLFKSESSDDMHLYLSLVQNSEDNWQIICDLPIIIHNQH